MSNTSPELIIRPEFSIVLSGGFEVVSDPNESLHNLAALAVETVVEGTTDRIDDETTLHTYLPSWAECVRVAALTTHDISPDSNLLTSLELRAKGKRKLALLDDLEEDGSRRLFVSFGERKSNEYNYPLVVVKGQSLKYVKDTVTDLAQSFFDSLAA
jgi:hypothetical protein